MSAYDMQKMRMNGTQGNHLSVSTDVTKGSATAYTGHRREDEKKLDLIALLIMLFT